MPYSKSFRRSRRSYGTRRRYRKRGTRTVATRRTGRKVVRSVPRFRSPWKNPDARTGLFRFVYNDQAYTQGLSDLNGYIAHHDFAVNSLYDPDITGFGIQPIGYDQIMGPTTSSLFTYYKVYASKITVYVHDISGATKEPPVRVNICPMINSSAGGISPLEQANFPGSRSNVVRNSDLTDKMKIRNYCKMKYLIPIGVNANDQRSIYSGSPPYLGYWHIDFDGASSCVEDTTVKYDIKIVYYAKLWKLDPLNSS